MATRKTVLEYAARIGATVTVRYFGDNLDVMIDAPAGRAWACDGDLHCLVGNQNNGRLPPLWTDLMERMRAGLGDCPDGGLAANCERCAPESDDDR